jgi:hypothetical protein
MFVMPVFPVIGREIGRNANPTHIEHGNKFRYWENP